MSLSIHIDSMAIAFPPQIVLLYKELKVLLAPELTHSVNSLGLVFPNDLEE